MRTLYNEMIALVDENTSLRSASRKATPNKNITITFDLQQSDDRKKQFLVESFNNLALLVLNDGRLFQRPASTPLSSLKKPEMRPTIPEGVTELIDTS